MTTDGNPSDDQADSGSGRRDLLTKGAVAAAVVAAAGLARSQSAAAANSGNMIIGAVNSGTLTTELSGGSTLWVSNGNTIQNTSIIGVHTVNDSFGVGGSSAGTGGAGVWGSNTGLGGAGVWGSHDTASVGGVGVLGESQGGAAVMARGNVDVQADGSGVIYLSKGSVTSLTTGVFLGFIARDAAGNFYAGVADGQYRKLAGPTSAGAFHAITPVRVYDSRAAAPTPGVLAPNASRVVSIKDGRNSAGVVNAADVVPSGATAISYNLTVTGAAGPNFLSVAPGDATSTGVSTINFPGGFDLANGGVVKLDASRQIKVFCGNNTGSTHFIVDVTGYYL